jgi:GNAT superfamily N-acetyltransferase
VPHQRLPNVVHQRGRKLDNDVWEVRCWLTDDFPDGTEVDAPSEHWIPAWTVTESSRALARVATAGFDTSNVDNVWFVSVDEPKAAPAATNLVAFVGDQLAPGTIVSRYTFATMGVPNNLQAAAVRWYPATGLVHQIYVAPQWRRHQIGTRLLYTANAFNVAKNWPGHLHGDGRRTELGEFLALASLFPERIAPLETRMPPMDEQN